MASEIYWKNRPWLLAEIKQHLPEVVSCLCDEDILSSDDRDGVIRISEQANRLMDVIHKKISNSFTPFDFAIKFAWVLEKASVSSSRLADFIKELEERRTTVVSRKSSLDSMRNTVAGDGNKEPQIRSLSKSRSAGSIHQQVSERGRMRSESSSSAVSEGSSRKSSTGSNSSLSYQPGSAGSDSGLDQSHDSNPRRISNIMRQQSNLDPIDEQILSEANPVSESADYTCTSMQETMQAESAPIVPVAEEQNEINECSPPPEECSEPNPVNTEITTRNESTKLDCFMNTVLTAAHELYREDMEAASKEYHEMDQLYRKRISKLDADILELRHNLQESEQHIKDAEYEKALHAKDIQTKDKRISQRERQLAEKEQEIKRMREELEKMQRMREEVEKMQAKIQKTEDEVDRLRNQLTGQSRRKKLESLKELMDLLQKADDPGSIKTAITLKINTLKFEDRPSTSPPRVILN